MKASDGKRPKATGKFESIEASVVVQALGQNVDESFLDNLSELKLEDGVLDVDAHMMSAIEVVFAGGDMVPSERNVTVAMGHGTKADGDRDLWRQGKFQSHPKSTK
jgi:thioredoxin reductase